LLLLICSSNICFRKRFYLYRLHIQNRILENSSCLQFFQFIACRLALHHQAVPERDELFSSRWTCQIDKESVFCIGGASLVVLSAYADLCRLWRLSCTCLTIRFAVNPGVRWFCSFGKHTFSMPIMSTDSSLSAMITFLLAVLLFLTNVQL
jgi:hypothetical protein